MKHGRHDGEGNDTFKAARMVGMLRMLYQGRPRTFDELAKEFGIHVNTVSRYLRELEGPPLYIPIIWDKGDDNWTWRVSIMPGWKF